MQKLILADDFTGANDTGIQFVKNNIKVDILLDISKGYSGKSDVLVFNTDSRAVSIQEAKERVTRVLSLYEGMSVYKKIDSTLRGNIGAEIEACMDATNTLIAFICSALPDAGRIIKNGICYVNEVPLLETEFATDPKTPIISSSVKAIITSQTNIPVIEVMHDELCRPMVVNAKIKQAIAHNQKVIFSFDATTNQDLVRIINLSNSLDESVLLIGSSGLAGCMTMRKAILPMLFVVASMSEKTTQQVNYIRHDETNFVIDLDTELLLSSNQYNDSVIKQALAQFELGKNVIIKTDSSIEARNNVDNLSEKLALTRAELGDHICMKLSALTKEILIKNFYQLSAIFLTGGDIAIAVAKALNADSYHIAGEVENGVPFGYFLNSPLSRIPVITKAGGFGSDAVLKNTIEVIKNLS
ncbi:four-carbon acid sugar kinase family protein [Basfia succiniciproducens]|uniref:four-carbon acid sugar kinase family protein n=1 Tax=Basfia succiniciproducens TaxID=653940 RepID=UPI003FCD4B17